ncbi:beta-lactamase/transpeptidase-like protein [Podospora appendiculata]|uniref:Beta-lactamase/transpeptidase-like protein n=1 Tax=Podospora appendiculata TaxID=314037 RepID=A0AAE0X5G6_9PEZI|nr:beta-lactamase/transpeptidase-like protein [Podospora appendiculata]
MLIARPARLLASFINRQWVAIANLCLAQNCPIAGPAYPPVTGTNLNLLPAFQAAETAFNDLLAQAFASGVSKVLTVYTILSRLSDTYWKEPVVKYIPELVNAPVGSAVDYVDWSEITLGALASRMSDAYGDLSAGLPSGIIPGLPALNESTAIQCGTLQFGMRPCTRAETMGLILAKPPVTLSYNTPIYSNMAFQLLSYAVENITKQPFYDLVEESLLQPLGLERTFLSNINDTKAVVVDGWTIDPGDEAPAGGYFQSLTDLSKMGRSILKSSLLPNVTTRKWLKPRIGQYSSWFALSPDHDIGISILVAGPSAGPAFALQAARDQAAVNFAGKYALSDNSSAEFSLRPNEPGLFLASLVSNGTDIVSWLGPVLDLDPASKLGVWLYPVGLAGGPGSRVAFRGVFGLLGYPADQMEEACMSLGAVDALRFGGRALDLFVFEVAEDGKATAVEIPCLQKTLARDVV